jgi:hypothetical protein
MANRREEQKMSRIVADRWSPCPAGELDRLEGALQAGRFRHTLVTIALAVVAVLAVAAATYAVASSVWPSPTPIESNECTPCTPLLEGK